MRNRWAGLLRLSALAAVGGAFAFAVFASSNCGGSGSMRLGMGGNNATGGTTGSAGTTGGGGTTGTGGSGTSGTTGTGGGTGGANNSCSTDMDLTCGTGALPLPDGHVTNFNGNEWNGGAIGQWCNTDGLRGSVFSYSGGTAPMDGGTGSSHAHTVDTTAGNFVLTLTAAGMSAYAGGGIAFFRCVDVSAFTALQFTAYVASGDISQCDFVAELQTLEQRPTSQNPPGLCDQDAGVSCFNFPSVPVTLGTTSQTFTLPFANFTSTATMTNAAPTQVVGLQFQFTPRGNDSGADPTPCTAEIRIDDVDFVK